jgi:glycosyltransferase involved in cell wall biosynthesis
MTLPQPAVSVLLPFHEPGAEFDAAIRSIVAQDMPGWELLLIANNPNEVAYKRAQRWANSEDRIRLLEEPRQGIAFALNTGLRHAHAGLIARMDADDYSTPKRLGQQCRFLEAHPHIGLVSCRTRFSSAIAASEGFQRFVDWQNKLLSPEEHYRNRFIESPVAHPSVMFRRGLVDDWGPYDTGPVPEDYELWLRWMAKGTAFYKLPQPLLTWHDHPARLSRTHPNYSKEAFFRVKCQYLAQWIKGCVQPEKKIVICGGGRTARLRSELLAAQGVPIYAYTDVKKRILKEHRFIPLAELKQPGPWFLVNLISKRGVGSAIRAHFSKLGFQEERDFILAG